MFLLFGAPFNAFGETERKGSHYIQVYEQIVSFVVNKRFSMFGETEKGSCCIQVHVPVISFAVDK